MASSLNKGSLLQNAGGSGGGITTQALLSVTTAPSGSFAVGSKYYKSSDTKIYTAVTANTWVGATLSDPAFGVVYTFGGDTYVWDGNSLEKSDLNLLEKVANKSDSYTASSSTTYASTKALVDGLASVAVYTSMKFFSPTGSGTKDGSDWANAMEFTQATYDGLEDNIACFLLGGTYTIGLEFTTSALNPIYGGFTGVELENVNSEIIASDNVVGETGTTTFSPQSTVFNGEASYRIMTNVVSGYVNNVVFYQGLKTGNQGKGGGVYNQSTLINCKVVNCRACYGGGIANDSAISGGGTATTYTIGCEVINCLGWFDSDGTAPQGGGIHCNEVANNYITNCTIRNCQSRYVNGLSGGNGGGVYLGTAVNTKTIDCSAIRNGGGFYITKTVNCESINCRTYSNEGGTGGGGLYIQGTESPVLNYKATNCRTTQYGGGVFLDGGSPTLERCVFNHCSADVEGGAIYCSSSTPTLTSCIADSCYAPLNPKTNYGTLVSSFNNTTSTADLVVPNLKTKYAVNSGAVDINNKERYVHNSINNFTNIGSMTIVDGVATGAEGVGIETIGTPSLATATSWSIVSGNFTYVTGGGSAGQVIIGCSVESSDTVSPLILVDSTGLVKLYVSSDGATWNIFSGESSTLILTSGNTYNLKFAYNSVTGYEFFYSLDNGLSWTSTWTSATTTVAYCSAPIMIGNNKFNLNDYWINGTVDLKSALITVDGTTFWSPYNPKSLTLNAGTVFTGSALTDTIGTDDIKDMTSEADGHYEMYITAGRALQTTLGKYYISKIAPTVSNTANLDYYLHNIEPLQCYYNDSDVAVYTTDLVNCGSFTLTSGVISNLWIRPLNDNGTKTKLINRITVGKNGDYLTIKEAVDYFNSSAINDTEILLDGGIHLVADTITVNNSNYSLQIRGLGIGVTKLNASTGLTNKPMFDIKSECDINKVYADGTTLASYGTQTGENFISFTAGSELYHEIKDFTANGFKIGIADLIGCSPFLLDFIISNCDIGTQINYSGTPTNEVTIDFETGNFDNCPIGIDLLQANKTNFHIINLIANQVNAGDIFIKYTPATFILTDVTVSNITGCSFNYVGTLISGFDFTRPDGRDAQVVVISNVGEENKAGHTQLNIIDNTTTTTLTTRYVYYKVAGFRSKTNLLFAGTASGGSFTFTLDGETTGAINWSGTPATFKSNIETAIGALDSVTAVTATEKIANVEWLIEFTTAGEGYLLQQSATNSLTDVTAITVTPSFYTCKFKIEDNKITNLVEEPFDAFIMISGNIQCSASEIINLAIRKNGTQILFPMSIRISSNNQPFAFSLNTYLDNMKLDDYIELVASNTQSSGKTIIVQDLNWHIEQR